SSEPPDIQSTHGTCGVPNHGDGPASPLAVQIICANQLLGPCPSTPGMSYPRTTRVVMPPLPSGLRTMRHPCRGVPSNAFCARAVERVTGIGGFFFRAQDPQALAAWYEERLGIDPVPQSYERSPWRQQEGATAFAPFPQDSEMIGSPDHTWMINFRVDDLDAM